MQEFNNDSQFSAEDEPSGCSRDHMYMRLHSDGGSSMYRFAPMQNESKYNAPSDLDDQHTFEHGNVVSSAVPVVLGDHTSRAKATVDRLNQE